MDGLPNLTDSYYPSSTPLGGVKNQIKLKLSILDKYILNTNTNSNIITKTIIINFSNYLMALMKPK